MLTVEDFHVQFIILTANEKKSPIFSQFDRQASYMKSVNSRESSFLYENPGNGC